MIMQVYSVYDAAVKAFLPPFHMRSDGEAVRSFAEACAQKDHQFAKHARYFQLFGLGSFNDELGRYENFTAPVPLISALQALEDWKPAGNGLAAAADH